ncbi:hypothetical protein Gmet_3615 [Geobacter metallireducens GS-15]|uniref:Uncharacterized protein n=1 Tax=Geobacter metallireducens (strain ATCC 53774 / DSM 7210 / GS-15) TaxID=269799 RepID=J7LWC6_GEOMG|nr:hypothetical protein Gmet_3615 [Geobacter metallireducens GS-15]
MRTLNSLHRHNLKNIALWRVGRCRAMVCPARSTRSLSGAISDALRGICSAGKQLIHTINNMACGQAINPYY